MTEWSSPFTNGLTDGGPVSAASMWRIFRMLLGPTAEEADKGVVVGWDNELVATSPGADQVAIDTGAAFCHGTPYQNTATRTLTASRPSTGTTGKRVVLRKDIVNGGVRLTVIASADGTAALPALTQNDSTYWEIPICSFTHATNGAIAALTDEREFLTVGGESVKIVADAFEWQSKIATHYVCRFGENVLLNNAVYGDLADVGWNASGAAIASFPSSTGDFNAAGDPGEPYAEFTASGNTIGSPKVIGAVHLLNAIARLRGVASSRIRCIVQAQFAGTVDAADTSGVGVTYNVGAALGAGAGTGYWFTVGATNFEVYDGAVATDTGVVKDTNLHEFEIEIDVVAQTWRALIDGNVVKAAAALSTDRWPMSIAARMGASGSAFRVFSMEVIYA